MSFMMSAPSSGTDAGLPRGELVATYPTYADARAQVDRLAASDFPLTAVSIVGKDLRVVERVRGRLNYAQVALSAGVRGLLFGAMIGGFLYLLDPTGGPLRILTSALLGLAVWIIFGVVGFASRRGQHGFASTQAVVPGGYDLVVAFDHAARARQELGLGARTTAAPAAAPAAPTPPPAAQSTTGPAQPATGPADVAAGQPGAGHGSHAVGARAAAAEPAPGSAPAAAGAESEARPADAPVGLDRSYGVTLPPEEVQRLIEARGGRPATTPGPQDAHRQDARRPDGRRQD